MNFGPWALATGPLALLAGVVVALAVDARGHRRGMPRVEGTLWWLLAAGVLVARLAHVVRWWPEYAREPGSLIDPRVGGFVPWAGALAVLAAAGVVAARHPARRRPLVLTLAAGGLAWGLVSLTALRLEQATHLPLPTLALADLHGRSVAIGTLAGQPLVINVWATWCGPCQRELPMLVQAQKRRPDVRFVFVDAGESADAVQRFLAGQQLTPRHVLLDSSGAFGAHYNVRGYPTTLFIDTHGRLRDTHLGELSAATLAESLQRIAATPTATGESP
ncbi:prolipoprotein diacylglyceryl transferase family protein [Dyella sp. KRB-257]|uniref:prolipoprotein diacylglyceryl transferase family protein n=1 Tax=Dyella sp. KRB-257 TaxID=3400915 RepID=UPI003BFBA8A7